MKIHKSSYVQIVISKLSGALAGELALIRQNSGDTKEILNFCYYGIQSPPETIEKFIQTVLGIVGIIYLKCQPGKE